MKELRNQPIWLIWRYENSNGRENAKVPYSVTGYRTGTTRIYRRTWVLYNAGKKIFEMWVPAYGCNIYYQVDSVNLNDDGAEIVTTFYNERGHETIHGRTTIRVKIKDGKPVIDSLSAD